MIYIEDNINDLFLKLYSDIMSFGEESSPRGLKIKEIIAPRICLTNPRNRLIFNEIRKTDIYYAIGEFLWYMSGKNHLNHIQYYAPSISKFSDDGKTLNSAYGWNIFNRYGVDQFQACIDILRDDKDSRQAVIMMRSPEQVVLKTKDQICTNSLHFMIRENRLNLIVNMRSNDLWYGFVYDVFCFTLLQELMAYILDVELGVYYHIPNSLHVYEPQFYYKKLNITSDIITQMNILTFNLSLTSDTTISETVSIESRIRSYETKNIDVLIASIQSNLILTNFWKDLLYVLLCYKNTSEITKVKKLITDKSLIYFLEDKYENSK